VKLCVPFACDSAREFGGGCGGRGDSQDEDREGEVGGAEGEGLF